MSLIKVVIKVRQQRIKMTLIAILNANLMKSSLINLSRDFLTWSLWPAVSASIS